MTFKQRSMISLILALSLGLLISGSPRFRASLGNAAPAPGGGGRAPDDVPPYHSEARGHKQLKATLDPMQFPDAVTQNAYALASKVKSVLYQQPCYCHCDRSLAHTSLLDCFTGTHAAVCNICKAEAIYAYNETARKKSPAQIREGIVKGEWNKVDWSKYRVYKPI